MSNQPMTTRVSKPAVGGRIPTNEAGARRASTIIILIILGGLLAPVLLGIRSTSTEQSQKTAQYADLPLAFEPNAGQTDPAVRFSAQSAGSRLFFTASEVVVAVRRDGSAATEPHNADPPSPAAPSVLRVRSLDSSADVDIVPGPSLPGRVNHLIGSDPSRWYTDLPTYGAIDYRRLYSGVDLRYEGAKGRLKGTYTVAPGADPSQIRWRYDGGQVTGVDNAGNLKVLLAEPGVIAGEGVVVTDEAPVAWQDVGGRRRSVPVRYDLAADGTVGLALGNYDRADPLTIDPTLSYSTYLGGTGGDDGKGIAVDGAGNAYVAGSTTSIDFPTTDGALMEGPRPENLVGQDAFISKINPQGTALVYSTYLGGGGFDVANGIQVNPECPTDCAAYVTGETTAPLAGSDFFPTTSGALQTANAGGSDAFVAKLSPTGSSLDYSTLLGGAGEDYARGLAVNGAGEAYVTGQTSSTFSASGPIQPVNAYGGGDADAFVTKVNPSGLALEYFRYLGGVQSDSGRSIAVDGATNAYVTGETGSADFPASSPWQPGHGGSSDAFVTKVDPAGSALVYSRFLGGSSSEFGFGIAVDAVGSAYVAGLTDSGDFPIPGTSRSVQRSSGGSTDAFATKLNPLGSALEYSTYLGGSGTDWGLGIAIDPAGQASVVGWAESTEPKASGFQTANAGGRDAFVTTLDAAGSALVFSSYLGGSGQDQANAIAADGLGALYLTGQTSSTDFRTADPLQPSNAGAPDAFIAKVTEADSTTTTSSSIPGSSSTTSSSTSTSSSTTSSSTSSTSTTSPSTTTSSTSTTSSTTSSSTTSTTNPPTTSTSSSTTSTSTTTPSTTTSSTTSSSTTTPSTTSPSTTSSSISSTTPTSSSTTVSPSSSTTSSTTSSSTSSTTTSTTTPKPPTGTTTSSSSTTTSTPSGATTTTTTGSSTTSSSTTTSPGDGTTTTGLAGAATTTTGDQAGPTVQLSQLTAEPSQQLTVSGSGFPAGALSIELFSSPVLVGTTTADAAGTYSARVAIPADTALGNHRVVVSGSGGTPKAEAALNVVASRSEAVRGPAQSGTGGGVASQGAPTPPAPSPVSRGPLSRTGSDISTQLFLAMMAVLLGGLPLLAERALRPQRADRGEGRSR